MKLNIQSWIYFNLLLIFVPLMSGGSFLNVTKKCNCNIFEHNFKLSFLALASFSKTKIKWINETIPSQWQIKWTIKDFSRWFMHDRKINKMLQRFLKWFFISSALFYYFFQWSCPILLAPLNTFYNDLLCTSY